MELNSILEIIKRKEHQLKQFSKEIKEYENQGKKEQKIFIVRGKKNFHKAIQRNTGPKTFGYGVKWALDITDKGIANSFIQQNI